MRRCCISYLFWIQILFVGAVRKEHRLALRQNFNQYGNQKEFDTPLSDQCAAQENSLPDPETLCCGRYNSNINRITGAEETELDQFPWSMLLKATFQNGSNLSVYSCGGSLISRVYVLTAAHCVFRPKDTLVSIDMRLSTENNENCDEIGGKLYCVDNVLLQAEEVVHHPHFNYEKLLHDVALIRLQQYESTRHITPVCLPTINIDHMHLANLPLVVASWERNGPYVSDIKQSTMVHLVSHAECHKFYPFLSRSHLCAAGSIGEDTRKGDSGGPLMMMLEGSYYVIGVVSGRRVNGDLGYKTVPTLYTNVFHYVHWIRKNIRII